MRYACALLLAACQPSLSGDAVHLGRSARGITFGDGPNGAHVIFLSFAGADVTPGPDDATQNRSQLVLHPTTVPPFDGSAYPATATATITDWMQQFFAPFNAQIVTARPTSGLYTMCLVGGSPSLVSVDLHGAAGAAPLDCGNANEADVVFAFADAITPSSTGSVAAALKGIAITCAQEVAHAYGLGHTQNPDDIMFPQLENAQAGFGGPAEVQPDGTGACGDGAMQDSAGMLREVIGASSQAIEPPATVAEGGTCDADAGGYDCGIDAMGGSSHPRNTGCSAAGGAEAAPLALGLLVALFCIRRRCV